MPHDTVKFFPRLIIGCMAIYMGHMFGGREGGLANDF